MELTPFLLFDGTCAEAMAFYGSSFGVAPTVTLVGDSPLRAQYPAERHGRVLFAHLKSGSVEFSATDWLHPLRSPRVGNTVAMYVTASSFEELRVLFDRLKVGGDPALEDDLRDLPFGAYGHLADRFGVHWFFRAPPRSG